MCILRHTIMVLLCLLTGIAPMHAGTIDTGSVLREMYDLTVLPFFKNFRTRQFSSYDRTGGNKDWGTFLGNNGDAVILANIQGPGCISRYWTTKLGGIHGTLRVFLDGEEQPRISVEQGALFAGECSPFAKPLTGTSSAGWFSYFPIPFAKSCRIETIGGGDFYQVTYRSYPGEADVKTFVQDLGAAQVELDNVLGAWKDPARSIHRQSGARTYKVEIPGVSRAILARLSGPACIDELALEANSLNSTELQKTVLRIYWDDERHPSVEVPLADFFGNGFGKLEYASLPLGLTKGIYYCRFPMPFERSALIEIENGMRSPQSLEFRLTVRKLETTSNMGYFHAKRNRQVNKFGIPYTILRASGRGHFVGCVLNLEGQKGLGFLEGDELFYVDGEKEASIHGTGTEDYFNAGWYFMEGTFAMPLHGCTVRDEQNLRMQAYRFHLTDCVPFEKELRVYIEHGPTNSEPNTVYSSTAYWYQTEPHREFVLLPPASRLFYRGNVILPNDAIRITPEMVIEGECEVVQWNSLSDAWRGENILICNGDKPITAEITVPGEDRYEIVGYLASGVDFGKVKISIDGKYLGKTFDGYVPDGTTPATFSFGTAILSAGKHRVTFTPTGRNPASAGSRIGIEGIRITATSAYIKDWYVIGPFPNNDDSHFDTTYPPETKAFASNDLFDGIHQSVAWRKAVVRADGMVDLVAYCGADQYAIAYGTATVTAPRDMEAEMLVGSDDGVKVWLNGKLVHSNHTHRPMIPDTDVVRVTLKKGTNTLLIKVDQGGGPWGFSVRFRDPKGVLKYGLPS